jgi:hypothetical protein
MSQEHRLQIPAKYLKRQVYMPTSEYEDDEVKSCMTQLKKFSMKMEKVVQTSSYWGTGRALMEMRHIGTSLDHMV